MSATVTLESWGSGDLPLLERLIGDPRMTDHFGGPESPDKLRDRQSRYERLEGADRMFKIVDVASGAGVGSVGFWTKEWRDEQVYEIGWVVAIALAKHDNKLRFMHAFPNIDNAPSNATVVAGHEVPLRELELARLEQLEAELAADGASTCAPSQGDHRPSGLPWSCRVTRQPARRGERATHYARVERNAFTLAVRGSFTSRAYSGESTAIIATLPLASLWKPHP